jgi:hypothetical protein
MITRSKRDGDLVRPSNARKDWQFISNGRGGVATLCVRCRGEDLFLAAVILHNGVIGIRSQLTPLLIGTQLVAIRILAIILVVAGTALVPAAAKGIAAVDDLDERL